MTCDRRDFLLSLLGNDDIILNIDFAPTFLTFAGSCAPAEDDHNVPARYGIRTKQFK